MGDIRIENPIEKEKIVEVKVEVEKIVEKPVTVVKEVEKIVYRDVDVPAKLNFNLKISIWINAILLCALVLALLF